MWQSGRAVHPLPAAAALAAAATYRITEGVEAWPAQIERGPVVVKPEPKPVKLDAATRQSHPWTPYENSHTETSLPGFSLIPRAFYRYRWKFLHPLARPLVSLPGRHRPLTIGETVMLVIIVGATIGLAAATWGLKLEQFTSTGSVSMIPLLLTFTLAMRGSPWTLLLGIPFERQITWHHLMSWVALAMVLYHGVLTSYQDVQLPVSHLRQDSNWDYYWTGWAGFGTICLLVLTSSWPLLRRRVFLLWYVLHIGSLVATIVLVVMHEQAAFLIAAGVWGLDLSLRYIYMAGLCNPHRVLLAALPGGVARIGWPKGSFQYSGGQYVMVAIPSLNPFEFHPFSLSSSPHHEMVYLHARAVGRWTKKLHALALKGSQPGLVSTVAALIEGPFGSPAIDMDGDRLSMFLLICGGIGVTPIQSVFNSLLDQHSRGRPLKKVWFLWSVRDTAMLDSDQGVLMHDKAYASALLPRNLPSGFQPDLLSTNVGMTPTQPLASNPLFASSIDINIEVVTAGSQSNLRPGAVKANSFGAGQDDIFVTEFFLTQVRDASRFDAGNIHPKMQPALRFGRPNLPITFSKMRTLAAAAGEKSVGVVVCGPGPMVADIQKLAWAESVGDVTFRVHSEVFEL